MNLERFLSRKFHLAAFALAASTIALFNDLCDFPQWSNCAQWILVLYFTANVTQKAVIKDA